MSSAVIYHRADYDGILSAAVCLHFLGPETVLHPWDYGDPVPEIPSECTAIYIVDLSVPELMGDPRLIWIDHHKTAIEKWDVCGTGKATIPGLRIDGVAACRLCWQWFRRQGDPCDLETFRERRVCEPLVLTLAGEYDVWDLHDERAIWLQHGLATYSYDPGILDNLLDRAAEWTGPAAGIRHTSGDLTTLDLIRTGQVIEGYLQAGAARTLAERSYVREWEGLTWLVLNSAAGNSRSFPQTDREWAVTQLVPSRGSGIPFTWDDIDAFMMWRHDGSKVIVSLYHKPGREDLDLSQIALRRGGGGHRGACGFSAELYAFAAVVGA